MDRNWNGHTSLNTGLLHYHGAAGDNVFHSHAAIQIVFGNDCSISYDIEANQVAPLYVRPMARHRLEATGDVNVILVEPSSQVGQLLLRSLPKQPVGSFDMRFLDLMRRTDDAVDLLPPPLREALIYLSGPEALQRRVEEASQRVGISTSRLRALSQSTLGVSLSRWRLWQALQASLEFLAAGASLADAAYAAGFSDQAHLTRRMKATLGLTPGQVVAGTGAKRAGDPFKTGDPRIL